MSAHSVPGSGLTCFRNLNRIIKPGRWEWQFRDSNLDLRHQRPILYADLNQDDMWTQRAHTFNKIHIELMEVIFVITVPSKCSCFLTLFLLVPPLSSKLP